MNKSDFNQHCSILSTLDTDGKLTCRFISRDSAPPTLEAFDEPGIGEYCDYSHLVKTEGIIEAENRSMEEKFAPLKGAGRYLDFYWEEQKAKIFTQ